MQNEPIWLVAANIHEELTDVYEFLLELDQLRRSRPGGGRWGLGRTTASKIMARKRPDLIPIEDSVGNRELELGRGDSWRLWWETFQAEGNYLKERATKLRVEVGRPELSKLRVFDVTLWN